MTTAAPIASSSQTDVSAARPSVWLAAGTLWQREVVRFLRQRSRVVGALATPVVFWALLGFGLNDAFIIRGEATVSGPADMAGGSDRMGYLAYFYPGTLVMIILFTAIFSTISVIEDRREGFLQGVLVSPAPRVAIALGKVMGGTTLALLQGALFLLAWPWVVGGWPTLGQAGAALGAMFVLGLSLTAMGLCIAWPMRSTAGFHAIMNLLLMPMWFLSGSLFPVAVAPLAMRVVMYLNPVTYGHALMARAVLGPPIAEAVPPLWISWGISLAAAVFWLGLATWLIARPSRSGA